jgi:NAD-dependent histone deacetylase SIR2
MPIAIITPDCARQLQMIADTIARSKKTIVVTGAGISTNCGIPVWEPLLIFEGKVIANPKNLVQDFRSVGGLYNLVKAQYPNAVVKGRDLFDAVLWSDAASTALFYTFLANLRNEVLNVKETSSVHKFIRVLAESGRLLRCYTQNIDGLEEREGLVMNLSHGKGKRKRPSPITEADDRTDKEKGCQVVQLHGNLKTLRCTNCQLLTEYSPSQVATLLSGVAPACMACETASVSRQAAGKRATRVGLLRPNIVLYGEEHPDADMVGKLAEADINAAPDLMVIMGTSLKVHGLKFVVKEFAKAVHAKGGNVIFINNTAPSESAWNDVIDFHVQMDCDAWVADVKARRAGIWERQTKLAMQKVSKATAAAAEKKAPIADKENAGTRKRKILEPKTPSKGRAKKAFGASKILQETPYLSPPFSAKKRSLKGLDVPELPQGTPTKRSPIKRCKSFELDLRKPSQRTPTKRASAAQKKDAILQSSPPSPPSTPSVRGGRMVAVQIIHASPEKQLRDEMQIFDDGTGDEGSGAMERSEITMAMTPSRRSSRRVTVNA